jgi:hypothetical protein
MVNENLILNNLNNIILLLFFITFSIEIKYYICLWIYILNLMNCIFL